MLPSTTLSYKPCTKHFPAPLCTTQSLRPVLLCTTKLAQTTSQHYFVLQSLHKALPSIYYFVLQSLHRARPSTTLYYKACKKCFPVLLCPTSLAQSTFQHHFVLHKACAQYFCVLQSLPKLLPSTTLYYKACTKPFPVYITLYYKACTEHVPVLLCTTKLAQSTSQHYFVLHKACTKHFPALLCTTQSTSQYYFVLQSLHKLLPSTTLYYKACTNHFPALLCTTQSLRPVLLGTTKLAKSTPQYYFVLRSLRKALPSTTLHCKPCTEYVPVLLCDTKLAQRKLLYTASSFAEKLLHTAGFLNREAFTQKLLHTTSFYTEKLLDPASCHTQEAFTHRTLTHSALHMASVYTHRNFYTEKLLHTASFYTQNLLHTASFYRKRLKKVFTQRSFLVHNHTRNCSSKAGISAPKPKKNAILKEFFKGLLKGKLLAPKH